MLKYDVQGMDDSGNEAQQSQEDIQPEMAFQADLQEYAQRRQKNGKRILIGSVAVTAMGNSFR